MNRGALALSKTGLSLQAVRTLLAERGVTVSRQAIHRWRRGDASPSTEARAALGQAPLAIDPCAWDLLANDAAPRLAQAAPVRVGRSTGQTRSRPRAGEAVAAPPSAVTRTRQAPDSSPAGGVTVTTMRSAADLAEEQLAEIQVYRQQFRDSKLDIRAAALLADMEGKAIERYARLTGEVPSPETVLARSPAWQRLRDKVFGALERFPDATRAVLEVLEGGPRS
jgi:hypothetical protein